MAVAFFANIKLVALSHCHFNVGDRESRINSVGCQEVANAGLGRHSLLFQWPRMPAYDTDKDVRNQSSHITGISGIPLIAGL